VQQSVGADNSRGGEGGGDSKPIADEDNGERDQCDVQRGGKVGRGRGGRGRKGNRGGRGAGSDDNAIDSMIADDESDADDHTSETGQEQVQKSLGRDDNRGSEGGGGGSNGKQLRQPPVSLIQADSGLSSGQAEQVQPSSADAAAEEATVTAAKRKKRLAVQDRKAERIQFNFDGKEFHDELVKDMLANKMQMPTGMFTGVSLGPDSERHKIDFGLVPKAVIASSYPCETVNVLAWVIQNAKVNHYTNGVYLKLMSIMDDHAIILLNPRVNLTHGIIVVIGHVNVPI